MRKFIVGAQGLDKAQEQMFLDFLSEKGCGWWHWVNNVWMVTTHSQDLSVADIRDAIETTHEDSRNIVIEITDTVTWAGYGPTKEDNNMFDWVKSTWNP